MSSTIRYQFVENTLGVAFTLDNFPYTSDGDDRQIKYVKRDIAAIDVGTAAGKLGHANGAILAVVPSTTNVLWAQATVYRPLTAIADVGTPYKEMTGVTVPVVTPLTQMQLQVVVGADNTIRGIDGNASAGTSAIATGDIIIVMMITGAAENPSDVMNP